MAKHLGVVVAIFSFGLAVGLQIAAIVTGTGMEQLPPTVFCGAALWFAVAMDRWANRHDTV